MERQKIKSRAVVSVGFDNGVMEVEYSGGKVYRYNGVPEGVYQRVVGAESVGAAVRALAASGDFEVSKVEPEILEFE